MMLESLEMVEEAAVIRQAVKDVLEQGIGTPELGPDKPLGCKEVGDLLAAVVAEGDAFSFETYLDSLATTA